MRRTFLALVAAVALVAGGLGAGSASAATTGRSCNLSANWQVNFSATVYNGDLSYMVITSPGPLFYGTSSSVATRARVWAGETGAWNRSFSHVTGTSNPYTYRANFDGSAGAGVTLVSAVAEAYPSGIRCGVEWRP